MSKIFIIIGFVFILSSCIKEDIPKISDEYLLNSSISFPIREIDMGIDDFIASSTFYEYYQINDYALISQYINFDYSNMVDNPEYLKKLMYRFYIENKFPARLEIETYFLDSFNNILDTKDIISEDPIMVNAAVTDVDGKLKQSKTNIVDITIDENDQEILQKIRKVLIVVYFYDLDENPQVINNLDTYNVLISAGVRAEIEVPLNI